MASHVTSFAYSLITKSAQNNIQCLTNFHATKLRKIDYPLNLSLNQRPMPSLSQMLSTQAAYIAPKNVLVLLDVMHQQSPRMNLVSKLSRLHFT